MNALKDFLLKQIDNNPLTSAQRQEWANVKAALQNCHDVETALNSVSDPDLTNIVIAETGKFVASIDNEYAYKIAHGDVRWPATRILEKLINGLPEGDPILHVITPNYDMLFEYACDFAEILYSNGFLGCMEHKTDWNAIDRALLFPDKIGQRGKSKLVYKHRKHARLHKVHGSLNYFFHRNTVIENNAWMWNPPNFAERVIITPGLSKYQRLQHYRLELLKAADAAIERSSHFLFIGYGFNDDHLEEYIQRKLVKQECRGLIITRDLNQRIETLLNESPNLWLVCKLQDADDEGSRIFNKRYSEWLSLPDKRLWDINEFTTYILGG